MFDKVKISQLSDRKKQFLTFSACFFLAAIIWIINALNKSYIVRIPIPITGHSPVSTVSTSINQVEVELKGKGFLLLKVIAESSDYTLDISAGSAGSRDTNFNTRKGLEAFLRPYERSFESIRVYPETISLQQSAIYSRKLPVALQLQFVESNNYISSGPAIVYPDSVWVFSSNPFPDDLKYVSTEKVSSELTETAFFQSTRVLLPDSEVYCELDHVWVYQETEKSTEKVLSITVQPPKGSICVPRQIELKCIVPVSKFDLTKPQRFIILSRNPPMGSDLSIISLRHFPYWCKKIQFQPSAVHCFKTRSSGL